LGANAEQAHNDPSLRHIILGIDPPGIIELRKIKLMRLAQPSGNYFTKGFLQRRQTTHFVYSKTKGIEQMDELTT